MMLLVIDSVGELFYQLLCGCLSRLHQCL